MIVNRAEFAEIVGFSAQQVQEWMKAGMPGDAGRRGKECRIDTAAAIRWLVDRGSTKRSASSGDDSERERLNREQADKVALQNAQTRKQLVRREHVQLVLLESNALLAGQLDGVAGRLANEIAGTTEPAKIRQLLLDEHRRIRSAYADALGKLAESGGGSEFDEGDSLPAEEADAE
jgi:phage terminase Nu1 subunit (DNA packaging protein)